MSEEIGEIKNFPYEIKHFEWRIPDFFTIVEDKIVFFYESPAFSVADTSWHLRLHQIPFDSLSFPQLFLYNNNKIKQEYLVEYFVGFKSYDGRIKHFGCGILKGDQLHSNKHKIDTSELMQEKSKLVPDNVLTITCTLNLMTEITHSPEQTAIDPTRHLMLISK